MHDEQYVSMWSVDFWVCWFLRITIYGVILEGIKFFQVLSIKIIKIFLYQDTFNRKNPNNHNSIMVKTWSFAKFKMLENYHIAEYPSSGIYTVLMFQI